MGALDSLYADLKRQAAQRTDAALTRHLSVPQGIDFTSNDYLGFSQDPWLKSEVQRCVEQWGAGSGASRLLRGQTHLFEQTEAALARMSAREAALLFTSGFSLNIGLYASLAGPEDAIFSDSLNHASIIDGIRLSKAKRVIFKHGDLSDLENRLRETEIKGRTFVVTESLFSMDGDKSELEKICTLAESYGAAVIVDEAHATGIYGASGSGLVEACGLHERVLCTIHTGGKAMGVGGAWLACDQILKEHLINTCRSFIYSTAAIPALTGGLLSAIELRRNAPERVESLIAKSNYVRSSLRQKGIDTLDSQSQIIPVMVGSNSRAIEIAHRLQADGLDVRAIRPPTVPPGTSRLRVTIRSNVDQADLQTLVNRIAHHLESTP